MCSEGGALAITAPSYAHLADCTLRGNRAGSAGGAVALLGTSGAVQLDLEATAFARNRAPRGADAAQSVNATTRVATRSETGTTARQIQGTGLGRFAWRPRSVPAARMRVKERERGQRVEVGGTTYPQLLSGREDWIQQARRVLSTLLPVDLSHIKCVMRLGTGVST